MARNATIVSFDDAKRSSRAARARSRRTPDGASAPRSSRPLVFADPGSDSRFSSNRPSASRGARSVRSADTARRVQSAASQRAQSAASPRRAQSSAASRQASPSRSANSFGVSSQRRERPSWYSGPDERALREEQARRAQVREEAREIEDEEQDKKKVSPLQKLRRAAAKRKADKVFGDDSHAPAAGGAGPRAALYKGEMGSSQRRATRMQDDVASETDQGKPSSNRRFIGSRAMRIALASVACLALLCIFLYQPARDCYQSMRHYAALEAEYAALQEREAALQTSVDALSTDAGMEDLAHDQFGLVKEGEVAVSVAGVEADESSSDSSIPPYVSSGSVDPPDTWYSGILDPLFGVE